MAVNYEAKIRYKGIVGMGRREFRNAFIKPMYEELGKYWMRYIRPKHFTNAGASEYGYLPRMGERGSEWRGKFRASYTGRKLKEKGHTRPLEHSGELKRLSGYSRFSHSYSGMRIMLPRAGKANYRHPNSKIKMQHELTRISRADAHELLRLGNRYLAAKLRNYPRSVIRTV